MSAVIQNSDSCDTSQMVHVAIMRSVRPGREREFERLVQQFFEEAAKQPGVCGAYLIRPFAGVQSREYGILRSFASDEDRERFYTSKLYVDWNEAVAPLVEGPPQRKELHGLEAFFRGGDAAAPPPRWKMAILTWVGVNPAVYVFSNGIPALVDLPMLPGLLLVNAFVVGSLAWVLMPALTKIFAGWLRRPAP
jgi:antibiotic biosynthesis monooxygenase (ABM) superfamily enzyme